jgi:hypothetical protein
LIMKRYNMAIAVLLALVLLLWLVTTRIRKKGS